MISELEDKPPPSKMDNPLGSGYSHSLMSNPTVILCRYIMGKRGLAFWSGICGLHSPKRCNLFPRLASWLVDI